MKNDCKVSVRLTQLYKFLCSMSVAVDSAALLVNVRHFAEHLSNFVILLFAVCTASKFALSLIALLS